MAQQVVALHGGTSFDSHEEYIEFIKTRDISLEKLKRPDDWKAALASDLGEGFEVLIPKMPNTTNVRYEEWKIWFERCIPFLQDGVILIGHSLGGIFFAKYLSENTFPKKITATILVGSPFSDTSTVESLKDFTLPKSLKKFSDQSEGIYLVHSKDDPVVPFSETALYQQVIPDVKIVSFEKEGHFNQDHFPELVDLIQTISKG
jgi:uncharacterized protein